MSKHTPGPWKWTKIEYPVDVYNTSRTENVSVWTLSGSHDKTNYHPKEVLEIKQGAIDCSTLPDEENARLIAAAPEMLEALALLESYYRYMPERVVVKIEAAIAKATGKE